MKVRNAMVTYETAEYVTLRIPGDIIDGNGDVVKQSRLEMKNDIHGVRYIRTLHRVYRAKYKPVEGDVIENITWGKVDET
jgi:hypothetical protein